MNSRPAEGIRFDLGQYASRRGLETAGMRTLLIGLSLAFAAAAAAQQRGTELDRAYDELLAAHLLLQKAEAAREAGVEAQPGERLGTVGGRSRLSDEYWERQKRLENEVERARKGVDQAIERWNALR
jgi:hypothetical protein